MADESDNKPEENNGGSLNGSPEFTVKVSEEVEPNGILHNEEKPEEEVQEEFEIIDLNDETAFQFLKKSKGFDAESLDDLVKPKDSKKLSATAEKYQEYVEKTGNESMSDFLATQKEWDKEDPDTVLKQLLKIENPTLDKKEIDFLFEEKYSYDEDSYDEKDKTRKEINKKVDLQKGLTFLEKQKQDYMVFRGSDDNVPEEYKNAKNLMDQLNTEISQNDKINLQKRNDFISTTEALFSKDFEGFKTKIGDEEFVIKPNDLGKTKEAQMDIRNIQEKFFDKDEKLIDPVGYHKALYFANNPDEVARHYFNLGKASMAEQEERDSKNIPDKNGIREANRPTGDKQFTVKVVE